MLHQAGEPRAGHVQGRTRALGLGTVFAKALVLASESMYPFCLYLRSLSMGRLLRSCGERDVNHYDQNYTLLITLAIHSQNRETNPRPLWMVVGYQMRFERGSRAPANNNTETRLCCKYICTTERIRFARNPLNQRKKATISTNLRNSISADWYTAGSADRRNDWD